VRDVETIAADPIRQAGKAAGPFVTMPLSCSAPKVTLAAGLA
jgi:hypothetical protein